MAQVDWALRQHVHVISHVTAHFTSSTATGWTFLATLGSWVGCVAYDHVAVNKHKWMISNEFEGFQTEPMCTDSRRTMVLNSQVTRTPSINTRYCFRNVEIFFKKYFQLKDYTCSILYRLLVITIHLITTLTSSKAKTKPKKGWHFSTKTSKLHLKKRLKDKNCRSGWNEGSFLFIQLYF